MKAKQRRIRLTRNSRRFIRTALERVSLGPDPFGTQLAFRDGKLHVSINVVGVETGEPASLEFSNAHPLLWSIDEALDWIYVCIRTAWVHELNEIYLVDGERRRDLHDEGGAVVTPPEEAMIDELYAFKHRLRYFLRDASRLAKELNATDL